MAAFSNTTDSYSTTAPRYYVIRIYSDTSLSTHSFTNLPADEALNYKTRHQLWHRGHGLRRPDVQKIAKDAAHELIAAFHAALLRATAPLPPVFAPDPIELPPVQRSAGCRDAKFRYWRTRALVHR